MNIDGAVALVTGSNRGLGKSFVLELLARGATTVYSTARDVSSIDLPATTPLQLDITDTSSVQAARSLAPDVTLLINNAGVLTHADFLDGGEADIRREMEVAYFGTMNVMRAFAPVIEHNGGGTILNVLSVLSWVHYPTFGAYSAAKAAEWALTNVTRQELAGRGVNVIGLHVGYMDTDMAAHVDPSAKIDPRKVAILGVDGIENDVFEVVADPESREALAGLSGGVAALYPALGRG